MKAHKKYLIVTLGLRPGEKMHEQLSAPDETVHATEERRVSLIETPKGFSEMPHPLRVSLENGDVVGLLNFLATEFWEGKSRPVAPEGLDSNLVSLGSITEAEE